MSGIPPEYKVTPARDFEDHWQRLRMLLDEPTEFAIQFVFNGDDELWQALLTRLQRGAEQRRIDCLHLPDSASEPQAGDTSPAQGITRACLARILPEEPAKRPRVTVLDLHQTLGDTLGDNASGNREQTLDDTRALLLSRLNERRAQLGERGPLVLILPQDWTKPAAQYAPDLWTRRLSSLYLEPPELPDETVPEALDASDTPPSPLRPGHAAILARWREAISNGQQARLPVPDGWLAAKAALRQGSPEEAEAIARLALQFAYAHGDLSEQMISQSLLGDLYLRRGKTLLATEAHETALHLAQQGAQANPDNTMWQRHLSIGYNRMADIQSRSDPAAALENYQASLAIRQALAQREPENTQWQRDLSVSYNGVADIQRRSDPAAALKNYQASLAIRQALAQREPENTQWQRDLSVSYNKVADIQRRSDPAAALKNYRASLAITQALTQNEPKNTQWQRDLSVSYNKVADIQRRSDPTAALKNYQASLAIRQALTQREPENTQWQRDLSVSYNKVAYILRRSDPAAAQKNHMASLAIRQTLARQEPENITAQTDLIVSHVNLAELHPHLPTAEARAHLQEALRLAQHLQDEGHLTLDQADWPADLQHKLDALPPT